jgi:hypothetical protein
MAMVHFNKVCPQVDRGIDLKARNLRAKWGALSMFFAGCFWHKSCIELRATLF